jgi:hypothetical protein
MNHRPKSLDPLKCQTEVVTPGLRFFYYHQCTRKPWKDGKCKVHHPDNIKAREEAREAESKQRWENSPTMKLVAALEKIKKLEREIKRLKSK